MHVSARPRQLQFSALKDYTRTRHGGAAACGRRKLARPLATRTPMHLVLRATRAKGSLSMLSRAHFHRVGAIVERAARASEVRILQFANAGNHLHLLVQARTREGFRAFLRTITGLIARAVTGAVKGRPRGRFWDGLAFSRVVRWGRDLRNAERYVLQNTLEAFGVSTARKPKARAGPLLVGMEALGQRGMSA